MDGPDIFNFTLRVVPETVEQILAKAGLEQEDIDLFVFHQANAFMLEHLRKKLKVPAEKFFVSLAESGNTVSSTIPIALADAERQGALTSGMRVMLLGFGVGLSWGGLVATW
jgi:3-oxoacyl-[acyl-carrier-protein] synthase-3